MEVQRTIPDTIVNGVLDMSYFIMGRFTFVEEKQEEPRTEEICTQFYRQYEQGVVVARERGDVTGKYHYHFVIQVLRNKYASAITARESVRKHIKKHYPELTGNESYSCKISNDPVNAVAYTVKEGDFYIDGWNNFFFLIVKNNLGQMRASVRRNIRV